MSWSTRVACLCLLVASSTWGAAARADSGRLHLHLDLGMGAPIAGQARPQAGGTSAGGVGWLGIDWQLAPPIAIEAVLGFGGFARPYPRSSYTSTRYTHFGIGARFRFVDMQRGYANERGGDFWSHLWVSAHVGYHLFDRQQFGVDAAVGYAFSVRRPLHVGAFIRTALAFGGQHPGPDMMLVGGIELSLEVKRHPGQLDSDGDGLPDEREIELGTDPFRADTDGDGIPDGIEVETGTDPRRVDTDDDGLADGVEDANRDGVLDPGETDPRRADTDGGGMPDGEEVRSRRHDPRDPSDDDRDRDGVPDHVDSCPDTPQGATVDASGCEPVPEPEQENFVLEGVTFASGSAELLPESLPVLERALTLLRRHPTVRYEIAGFTDNRGNRRLNRQLSEQRAEAVKAWFVGQGLHAHRFDARGYGSAQPIESNATTEGRARNRRIELRRLGN